MIDHLLLIGVINYCYHPKILGFQIIFFVNLTEK